MEDTSNSSHQNNDHYDENIVHEEKIVAASDSKVVLTAENNNTTSSHNSTTITSSTQPDIDRKTETSTDSENTITTCKLPDESRDEKQLSRLVEEENEVVTVSTTSTTTTESTNEACRLETPAELHDVNNASTEVLLDVSISDRLAGLSIGGDTSSSTSVNHLDDEAKEKPAASEEKPASKALKDKAELSRSILAGEVSDNSECSIEIEEEEASDYDKVECSGNGVSDEEMFIEDQDEDVEEEEEFHEVEEEKHKSSQELSGAASRSGVSPRAALRAPKSASSNSSTKTETPEATTASEKLGETLSSLEPSEQTANSAPNENELTALSQSVVNKDTVEMDPQLAQKNVTFSETKQGETQVSANEPQSEELADTREGAKSTDWANLMLSTNIQGSTGGVDGEKASEDSLETASKKGDGKEGQKEEDVEKKELDLDEDVKNPQYIPKKGVFYEHDDRSHDVNSKKQPSAVKNDEDTTEMKESAAGTTNSKKVNSQEKQVDNRRGNRRQRTETDRWGHDLFKDEKQKPKSKSELINAYGYDIRQERSSRNQPSDSRQSRGNNSNNSADRPQGSQDNQRSRQGRDNRRPRENQQPSNRSRDRRSRRPNNNRNRTENPNSLPKRDNQSNTRSMKPDQKESTDNKQSFQNSTAQQQSQQSSSSTVAPNRRDNHDGGLRDRNARSDNRGRRQNSKDRPLSNSVEDRSLPPITTVMPPITTWSNKIEDMVKEEASRKESPSRNQQQQHMLNMNNSIAKSRQTDQWPQNTPNKSVFTERPQRTMDENRQQQFQQSQQQYTSRRYQDRDEGHKPTQFINRNQYIDGRSSQHNSDWRRTNNYNNTYAKSNEYEPIKTQTFENSRLAQNNMNRSHFRDNRDAREIINERRMQNHQNFQQKVQPGITGLEQHQHARHQQQHQHLHHHQQHHHQHQQQQQPQSQLLHHHQVLQHQQMFQQQQANPQQHLRSQQPTVSLQQQQHQHSQNQQSSHQQPSQQPASQQLTGQRQSQQQISGSGLQSTQSNQTQRQTIGTAVGAIANTVNNVADGVQESGRLNSNTSTSNDLINSRPIVKTDAYNSANVAQHQQQQQPNQSIQQHSQPNHRSIGTAGASGASHVSQQAPGSSGSHLLASQLSSAAGNQPQYYSPTSSSRDPAAVAAALATAYHGYIPGGHSVMDTSRYHMTSQQLSDHGYMASPGQSNDVATASVLHQQGMYADTTPAGGTVASSAYMSQANSNLSPSTNIPVTGAGPPMPPVSYLQHSQYAPPPYSNPYTQPPQPPHNQAPPQSTHAYPYWTYI